MDFDTGILAGEWYHPTSTNVAGWRYEADDQTLEVEFHNGSTYQYYGVPTGMVRRLFYTDSPGRFVWQWLRGRYSYAKIG